MNRPEQSFQRYVAAYLTLRLGGNAWFTAFPAGGGGRIRGALLKAMGLKAGVPDILIVDDGKAFWLELKAKRGVVSEAQKECHSRLRRARSDVAVVRSLDDVDEALDRWGVAVNPGCYLVGSPVQRRERVSAG